MADRQHPDRATLEASQLEQLRSLLAELFPANKFYARKLQDRGITFDVASLGDFSTRFPFTTKQELVEDQLRQPPFGSNLTYPLERYTRFHQTSGTTGTPLRWLDTPESWNGMLESWMEVFQAAGIGVGDRVFFAFSFGPFLGFWTAFESAERLGCLCVPAGGLSTVARLRVMVDSGVTVLCCTPTYALRLAEVATKEKVDLRGLRLKKIVVAGEPGGSIPAIRARLESRWPGTCVFDHHGMTEVGPVSFECPARPGVLHIIESAYFAEVIDPAIGKPAAPGETGELVLTTLGRVGSPLLRYRTGDLVKCAPAGIRCRCGRHHLALEGGVLGRVDDMVIVRGVNIYPAAVDEIIRACGDVAEYQVHVSAARTLSELSVTVEPAPGCTDTVALVGRLAHQFNNAFGLRVRVTTATPGSLPRFEMKARRWVKS